MTPRMLQGLIYSADILFAIYNDVYIECRINVSLTD